MSDYVVRSECPVPSAQISVVGLARESFRIHAPVKWEEISRDEHENKTRRDCPRITRIGEDKIVLKLHNFTEAARPIPMSH
jgi:hypothetical protein